jgi:hypothetical protein
MSTPNRRRHDAWNSPPRETQRRLGACPTRILPLTFPFSILPDTAMRWFGQPISTSSVNLSVLKGPWNAPLAPTVGHSSIASYTDPHFGKVARHRTSISRYSRDLRNYLFNVELFKLIGFSSLRCLDSLLNLVIMFLCRQKQCPDNHK